MENNPTFFGAFETTWIKCCSSVIPDGEGPGGLAIGDDEQHSLPVKLLKAVKTPLNRIAITVGRTNERHSDSGLCDVVHRCLHGLSDTDWCVLPTRIEINDFNIPAKFVHYFGQYDSSLAPSRRDTSTHWTRSINENQSIDFRFLCFVSLSEDTVWTVHISDSLGVNATTL